MNKAKKFFEALPILDEITDLASAVMADAGFRSGEIEVPGQTGGPDAPKMTFPRDGRCVAASEIARELEGALKKKPVSRLKDKRVEQVSDAIQRYKSARTSEDFQKVHGQLGFGIPELEDIVDELAIDAFGYWGCHFFRVALQHQPVNDRILKRTPKRPAFPNRDEEPSRVLKDLRVRKLKEPDVTIDESQFSVSVGDRPPCVLGRTKGFDLLAVLLRRRNRLVPFVDIAEDLGGDHEDFDNVAVWKFRLVKALEVGGYPDLAKCIRSDVKHYGLFFD